MYAPYHGYMMSSIWKQKRAERLHNDSFRCQKCRSDKVKLTVHHRFGFVQKVRNNEAKYGDETMKDLISLCKSCHEWKHRRQNIKYETKGEKRARKRNLYKELQIKYAL